MAEIIKITKEQQIEFQNELDHLENHVKPEVLQQVEEAKAHGDLSENAEYDAARAELEKVNSRIAEITLYLKNSEIDNTIVDSSRVRKNCYVKIEFLKGHKKGVEEYQILDDLSAKLDKKSISENTPLAKAIIGKEQGDEVTFETPRGRMQVKIVEIKGNKDGK